MALDGEINLKPKFALKVTNSMLSDLVDLPTDSTEVHRTEVDSLLNEQSPVSMNKLGLSA